MRLLLAVILAALFSVPAYSASLLLSWGEFTSLSKEKRMQYLADMTQLMITMEKAEMKYEVKSGGNASLQLQELKEYIAMLEQMIAILPEAAAAEAPRPGIVPLYNSKTKAWECPEPRRFVFDTRLGTCVHQETSWFGLFPERHYDQNRCPEGSTAVISYVTPVRTGVKRLCVPQDSWNALTAERRIALARGDTFRHDFIQNESEANGRRYVIGGLTEGRAPNPASTGGGTQGAPNQGVAPPAGGLQPPNGQTAGTCEPPKLQCVNLEKQTKDDLIRAWRAQRSAEDNHCIAGGFFSSYPPNQIKVRGKCRVVTKFPSEQSPEIQCANPGVLCNPVLFCLSMPFDNKLKEHIKKGRNGEQRLRAMEQRYGNTPNIPMRVCASRTHQGLTEECAAKYKEYVGGKELDGFSGFKMQACDPAQITGLKIQETWNDLIKNTEDKFKKLCLGSEGFQAMFCEECKIMADQIARMNTGAQGTACRGGPNAPPAANQGPAQTSGETPRARR